MQEHEKTNPGSISGSLRRHSDAGMPCNRSPAGQPAARPPRPATAAQLGRRLVSFVRRTAHPSALERPAGSTQPHGRGYPPHPAGNQPPLAWLAVAERAHGGWRAEEVRCIFQPGASRAASCIADYGQVRSAQLVLRRCERDHICNASEVQLIRRGRKGRWERHRWCARG